ncbi:oocyte zinc finger protein XlCOF6-like [Palaemon carinicauda]|uniref:oocyte zinc finger protein XlCOF6-like n=1 Tax=Palaemon carinicauda TaxID=392227 RepID=UPI0035B69734
MKMFSPQNEVDAPPQGNEDEVNDELLTSVIGVGKEVAIKRYSADESKICKIRELGNEFVILEFSGDETEGEENLKTCTQELITKNEDECREGSGCQDLTTSFLGENTRKEKSPHSKAISNCRHFNCIECTSVFITPLDFNRHLMAHQHQEHDNQDRKCNDVNHNFIERSDSSCPNLMSEVEIDEEPKIEPEISWEKYNGENLERNEENTVELIGEELRGEESGDTYDGDIEAKEEEFKFECNGCKKSYRNRRGLNRHLRVHKGEKPYLCLICNRRYSYKHDLHNHVKNHTNSPLEIHKLSDYVDKPFKCGICTQQFSFEFDFERHLKDHNKHIEGTVEAVDETELQENQIPTVSSTSVVEENVDVVNGVLASDGSPENLYLRKLRPKITKLQDKGIENCNVCIYCKKEFANKASYDEHFMKSMKSKGNKPYGCCVCFRGFSYKQCLQKHLENHISDAQDGKETLKITKRKPSKCVVCHIVLSSKSELRGHMQTHGRTVKKKPKVKEKQFECEVCGREFAFERAFMKHCRAHNASHLYQCFLCDKNFVTKRKLTFHMKFHKKGGLDKVLPNFSVVGQGKKLHTEIVDKNHSGYNLSPENSSLDKDGHGTLEDPRYLQHPKMCKCFACHSDPGDGKKKQSARECPEDCVVIQECKHSGQVSPDSLEPCEKMQSCVESHRCLLCKRSFQDREKLDKHGLICPKLIAVDFIINSLL